MINQFSSHLKNIKPIKNILGKFTEHVKNDPEIGVAAVVTFTAVGAASALLAYKAFETMDKDFYLKNVDVDNDKFPFPFRHDPW